jgi:hypothetical protein
MEVAHKYLKKCLDAVRSVSCYREIKLIIVERIAQRSLLMTPNRTHGKIKYHSLRCLAVLTSSDRVMLEVETPLSLTKEEALNELIER